MTKRLFDIVVSFCGLLVLAPLIAIIASIIYAQDWHPPFYIAPRVGVGGKKFAMVKFRSMIFEADKSGVMSTSSTDSRITPIGAFVRKWKLDEVVQLWNVLKGDMSLVGPRPNVEAGTRHYTPKELGLLKVRPGITDFASIVFADEGNIVCGHENADVAYDKLIRPWKSRLGLFYVEVQSLDVDVTLILLTLVALISRRRALNAVAEELRKHGAPLDLVRTALRIDRLDPALPPT